MNPARKLRIVLYYINWNDSFYFPFIKEHYGKFCERIVMLDNYSTDDSVSIAQKLGFDVKTFGIKGVLDDYEYLNVKNEAWKECRGQGIDYVIVCDADEFICLDNPIGSAPKVTGYNIISETLPKKSVMEINTGSISESYSKQAIFNPDKISEIHFRPGCHFNNISGTVTTEGDCRLLHYRCIGGVERMIKRHDLYRPRMSVANIQHGLGYHYNYENIKKTAEWFLLKSQASELW
jgi:glycosyltransferase involved in cell wall biosynthesis